MALSTTIDEGRQFSLSLVTLSWNDQRIGIRSCSRLREITKKTTGMPFLQSSNTITVYSGLCHKQTFPLKNQSIIDKKIFAIGMT